MTDVRGWRIKTEHVTQFSYSDLAFASYNEVRVVPQSNSRQTRLEAKLATVPHAAQYTYWDYFGTQVVAFNIDQGHLDLQITSSSLVETQPPDPPPMGTWSDIEAARDSFAEYLMPTERTAPDAELSGLAEDLRAESPTATIEAVMGWVHDRLEYVPGVTGVQTSAVEAANAVGESARTSPTSRSHCSAQRVSRRDTSRDTCTRAPMLRSERKSQAKAMPGSTPGPAVGGHSTRRMP